MTVCYSKNTRNGETVKGNSKPKYIYIGQQSLYIYFEQTSRCKIGRKRQTDAHKGKVKKQSAARRASRESGGDGIGKGRKREEGQGGDTPWFLLRPPDMKS